MEEEPLRVLDDDEVEPEWLTHCVVVTTADTEYHVATDAHAVQKALKEDHELRLARESDDGYIYILPVGILAIRRFVESDTDPGEDKLWSLDEKFHQG